MTVYNVGIDNGSATVKAALLNERLETLFFQYSRYHFQTLIILYYDR